MRRWGTKYLSLKANLGSGVGTEQKRFSELIASLRDLLSHTLWKFWDKSYTLQTRKIFSPIFCQFILF